MNPNKEIEDLRKGLVDIEIQLKELEGKIQWDKLTPEQRNKLISTGYKFNTQIINRHYLDNDKNN